MTELERSNYQFVMETELKQHLLSLSAAYAAATGMKPTAIWIAVLNDRAFPSRLKSDKTITLRTYDRAVQWFSDNWPADLDWPSEVQRPAPSLAEAS